jgi:hypothetical protein
MQMEKGVIEAKSAAQPLPTIESVVFSGNHYRRIIEYESSLNVRFSYDGQAFEAEYPVTYGRSFKDANGTPSQETHDFSIKTPTALYQLPIFKEYPHQAIPIIIERSIVKKPEGKKEIIVTDLSDWLVAALREKLPHRVRRGLSHCIKGL